MASWASHSALSGLVWQRPLGISEQAFYWESTMNGAADVAQHNQIDVAAPHSWVMDPDNIRRALLSTKRRFPLLAAKIVRKEGDKICFEVPERRVKSLSIGELEIGVLSTSDDIALLTENFLNGPRELSDDLLVKVKVMSLPKRGMHRKNDYWSRYHIWIITAHPITDGAANMSLFTTFMDMLAAPSARLTRDSIGERLSMVPDGETLHDSPDHSIAKKRWRRAIAWAILTNQEARIKGGHRMPSRKGILQPTLGAAASRAYGVQLDNTQTAAVLQKCRDMGITLGNTTAVLCQIAHARILHRYRHTLPPGDWADRIRQPMHTVGPFTLRTRMSEEWQRKGGMQEVFAYINHSICTLPHMPFCDDQDPSYEELMSKEAFVRRCKSVKDQVDHWLHHPLLHEMCAWRSIPRIHRIRRVAKVYEGSELDTAPPDESLPEWIRQGSTVVYANEASSFGSMETAVQKEYPISTNGTKAPVMIVVREFQAYMRCPPRLLYLTMMGNFGRLWIGCWWDGNSWEDKMVREWVDEVASAAQFYLLDSQLIAPGREFLEESDYIMARL